MRLRAGLLTHSYITRDKFLQSHRNPRKGEFMKSFLEFLKSTSGSTGTMLALSAIPLIAASGAAIDFANRHNVETQLQQAVDSAALGAASAANMTDAERVTIAKEYFKIAAANTPFANKVPTVESKNAKVSIQLEIPVATTFTSVLGIEELPAKAISESLVVNDGKVEVILVLDFSYSMMANDKHVKMKAAAGQLIDTLALKQDGDNVKIGLVPFSAMVRTTMDKKYVTQSASGTDWTGCTQDQKYPYNTQASTPTSNNNTKFGYFDNTYENSGAYGCSAYASKNLDIIPLTTNLSEVKTKLSSMQPLGNTNIALGAQFGWLLLDPAQPYTQGSSYSDTNTSKFVVVLTDGVQTSKQFNAAGNRSVSAAEANLLTTCANMRAKDITIYTIAYDINNVTIENQLKNCSDDNYYAATVNGDSLNVVFQDISNKIHNQIARLTK
jgi:Flp pilus assembly protein TadG